MKSKKILLTIILSLGLNVSFFKIAFSDLKFPLLIEKTGPFANKGPEFSQGIFDYFKLINERDGGIRGEKIIFPECEVGINIKDDLNCYKKHKANAVVFNSNSQSLSNKLILRTISDGVTVFTSGYGQSFFKNGKIFKWMFNSPSNYLDGASIAIRHILKMNFGNINGRKIAFIFSETSSGKNITEIFNILSKKYNYKLMLFPIKNAKNQKFIWPNVSKFKPNYIFFARP